MTTWVSLILALLKAIPTFERWFEQLSLAFFEWKLKKHDHAFTKGMIELAQKNDQRLLEEAAGLPTAGKPAENQDEVQTRPRRPQP